MLFLGYLDPPVAPGNLPQATTTDIAEYAGRIVSLLRTVDPDLVITHGSNGEYGHPQHVITHHAVLTGWRQWQGETDDQTGIALDTRAALYTFAAACSLGEAFGSFRNPSDAATTIVDISAVRQRKIRAFAAHATQVATTLRDAGLASTRGMFPPREYFRRWAGPPLLEAILSNEP